jgi:hypothetical protein
MTFDHNLLCLVRLFAAMLFSFSFRVFSVFRGSHFGFRKVLMFKPTNPSVRSWVGASCWQLALILLVAFALRMISLKWAEANTYGSQGDSLEACEVAVSYLNGEERARYIGQPNYNAHSKLPGRLWTIFCAAGLKLTGTPQGIVLLTIFANLAAIALTWWLTLELFGSTAALVGASLMAVSPWVVHDSAVVFNPAPMPLFGALIFTAVLWCVRQDKSRTIALLPFLILAGAQFHMSVLGLILPLVLLAWLARMKPNWAWFCIGLVAGVLCYVPYMEGEIAHHWQNTRGIFLGDSNRFSSSALKVFTSPLCFLVNYWFPNWTYAPGEYATLARYAFGSLSGLHAAYIMSGLFAGLAVTGALKIIADALRGFWVAPHDTFSRVPGVFICAGTVVIYLLQNLAGGKPFHARYCLLVLPLMFALTGAGVAKWLEVPCYRKFVVPFIVFTLASNLWFVVAISRFERDRISSGPVFVPGFGRLESIYRQLKARPGATGHIEIRDWDYLKSLAADDKLSHNAGLIRRYVELRERESQPPGPGSKKATAFLLRPAVAMDATNSAVGFSGSGITLVALP